MKPQWPELVRHLASFTVEQAKHYNCRLPLFGKAHRHEDIFHISYVQSGGGQVRVEDTLFRVGPQDVVFIRPGEIHASIRDARTDYELIEVKFSAATAKAANLVPHIPWITHVQHHAAFLAALERLVAAYLVDPFPGNWLVRLRLAEVLLLLERERRSPPASDLPAPDVARRVQQTVDYLGLHYAEPVSVRCLADLAGMSLSHFAASFKRVAGVSPIEFLIRRRLHHARELLQNSTLAVRQVAEVCGFSSAPYFARVFRQREGMSPGRFRRLAEPRP